MSWRISSVVAASLAAARLAEAQLPPSPPDYEESKAEVETASEQAPAPRPPKKPKPTVTIGAYIEPYFQLNIRRPDNGITNFRGFDNRDRTFTIDNAALDAKGELGPLAVRLILQIGATPSTYYLAEPKLPGTSVVNATGPELWKFIQTATLAYKAPYDILVEAGVFTSPIGPEVIPIKDDWNWSRSTLFFALPFYHTGVRASIPLGGGWTGTAAVYNGWNSVVDNNRMPSISVSAAYGSKSVAAQVLYFGGNERPTGSPEGEPWRHLLDAYVQVAITDKLSILAHADGGAEPNAFGTSGWLGGALYLKYAFLDQLYAAVRGDVLREWTASDAGRSASPLFFPSNWVSGTTATLAFQPADGISIRLEYRHDQAEAELYFDDDVEGDGVVVPFVPNSRAQDTLTLGAVAWF